MSWNKCVRRLETLPGAASVSPTLALWRTRLRSLRLWASRYVLDTSLRCAMAQQRVSTVGRKAQEYAYFTGGRLHPALLSDAETADWDR